MVLVSIDWDERFPNSHLRALGTDASDHCALLQQTNMGMSKARFHFEVFCPRLEDYGKIVLEAWRGPVSSRGPLARLNEMLRALVPALIRARTMI